LNKKLSLFTIICLFEINLFAQDYHWAKTFAGVDGKNLMGVSLDASNVYASGWFTGAADFDPGTGFFSKTSAGNRDAFVVKLNKGGGFEWAKTMGGTALDEGIKVHVSVDGSVYVAGNFFSTANFDVGVSNTNLSSFGSWDAFLAKFDSLGNFLWVRQLGGTGQEDVRGLCSDFAGNIYVGGTFSGTADFNPGTNTNNLVSSGSTDVFICKLNAQGNYVWARQLGSTVNEALFDIKIDKSNCLVVTGTYRGTVDFDLNSGVQNRTANTGFNSDSWICKWDTACTFIWAQVFGGTSFDQSNSVAIDHNNNILSCGYFAGTVDFNPGLGIFNLSAIATVDNYVLKLDPSGSFLWVKSFGGDQNQTATAIVVDDSNQVYCTGWFKDTADFDPDINVFNLMSNGGSEDAFVLKLSEIGTFMWAYQMGSSGFEIGNALAINSADNLLFLGGQFNSTPDFDPGPSTVFIASGGSSDGFLQAVTLNNSPALPVTFISFSVRTEPEWNALNWRTSMELNNKGFEVLRSVNGADFEKIGFVNGANNASEVKSYQFFDMTLSSAYYQLRQIDYDGASSYSQRIYASRVTNEVFVGPNPISDEISISNLEGTERILILNFNSKIVFEGLASSAQLKIEASQLPRGFYFVKVLKGGAAHVFKLVKY
jgi:hypothetical protein